MEARMIVPVMPSAFRRIQPCNYRSERAWNFRARVHPAFTPGSLAVTAMASAEWRYMYDRRLHAASCCDHH